MASVSRSLLGPRCTALRGAGGGILSNHSLPSLTLGVIRQEAIAGQRGRRNRVHASSLLSSPASKAFSTSAIPTAQYRRFGQPSGRGQASSNNGHGWAEIIQQAQSARGGGKGQGGFGGRSNVRGFDKQTKTILIVLVGGVGAYYVLHLERVPDTGRLRFIDVSVQQEKEMGKQTFQQTMQQYHSQILPSSDPRVQMVRRVAERIVEAARAHHEQGSLNAQHLPWAGGDQGSGASANGRGYQAQASDDTEWQVFVVNSKEKNAFVLANGKIFVFSGILPICKDEDGLATVLGHEVAHQIARHVAEKMSGFKIVIGLSIALQTLATMTVGDIGNLSFFLSRLLYELPNSRKVEVEADRIGLRLMSAACFDPTKAPGLWERMEKGEGRSNDSLSNAFESVLSTHPLSSKRMAKLKEWLPEAQQIREDTGCPSQSTLAGFRSAAGDGGVAAFPSLSRSAVGNDPFYGRR